MGSVALGMMQRGVQGDCCFIQWDTKFLQQWHGDIPTTACMTIREHHFTLALQSCDLENSTRRVHSTARFSEMKHFLNEETSK